VRPSRASGFLKPTLAAYGTNGFYLSFADSAAIGDDLSGNGNDWTANNLVATDVLLDSPTQNWATVNPLTKSSGGALQDGNLVIPFGGTYPSNVLGTVGVSTGKWYWEVGFAGGTSANGHACGVATSGWANRNSDPDSTNLSSSGVYHHYIDSRSWFDNNSVDTANSTTFAAGDIIGIALDCENDEVSFYKNNVLVGSAQSLESNQTWFPFHKNSSFTALTQTVEFGQGNFTYTPPTDFLPLNTANLPDPVIDPAQDDVPADYFNTVLYSGNNGTQSITGVGFSPDWLWIKVRNEVNSHYLFDQIRGADQALFSDSTSNEIDYSATGRMTSFDSDGFTVEYSSSTGTNASGDTYVAWNWLAGNGTASNTDGSITSTVSVNQKGWVLGGVVYGYWWKRYSGAWLGCCAKNDNSEISVTSR
jgi:hypothetical protein